MVDSTTLTHLDFANVKEGTRLTAVGTRGDTNLTEGKVYVSDGYMQAGYFEDRPFVVVTNDLGKKCLYHARRFKL